ncbi:unnamed protein product [Paramecium pentaurelia]|uniref:Uncharacterized protein n=1 Tax=Paramecium pentaurelia TaxID=43138 RepID=A0A8S1VX44_9CILI|nr:unnamed protein product [Paramecium pentaurelia]
MKYKKFLTTDCLNQIVKNIGKAQIRYLQNRIMIAYQLKLEFVGLYITFQEDSPFFQIYFGPNINNKKQDYHEMIKLIQDRLSQPFDNFNPIESKKKILGLFSQYNDNMKIKFELVWKYIQFAYILFNEHKWIMNDEINKHRLYSYFVRDYDYVTKNELVHPSLWLKSDSFLILPALVNQSTFFDYIFSVDSDKQKKVLKEYNKISNQLAIYLFEIRDILQEFAKQKLQIQIYPSLLNFNFIRIDNQKPYYLNHQHFERFVEQNSKVYAETKKNISYFEEYLEKNNQIQLRIFNFYPSDEIGSGLTFVQNKHREEYPKEFQEYWQSLYKQKYPSKRDVESLQIKAVSLEYLHSLNCNVNSSFDYIQHIIDPERMICKQCKQQIDDYGSLFYDKTFYQFYKCLKDILLSPYYIDIPGVYICPISLKLIGIKNNFMISSQILNQKGEHLITLYNQTLKFELREEFDAELEDDDEYYEIMNGIREKNQEQTLDDFNDDEQDEAKLNEK